MTRVIVSGALANKPGNGGEAWVRLSWLRGLQRLGCQVGFVEQISRTQLIDPAASEAEIEQHPAVEFFRRTTERFGLAASSVLIDENSETLAGLPQTELHEQADAADLLVNISGHLTEARLVRRFRRKAYIDIDPGFTQFWHADANNSFNTAGHDFYFTIGENIGRPDCPIPTGGIEWRPIRQPVVLDDWPVTPADDCSRFTTIASWRGPYGPIEWEGRTLGLKCHEFRKFLELPERLTTETQRAQSRDVGWDQRARERQPTISAAGRGSDDDNPESKIPDPKFQIASPSPQPSPEGRGSMRNATEGVPYRTVPCALFPVPSFELALAIHPADEKDLHLLQEHGWKLVDPRIAAGDAEAFRRYVQQSGAEFSVAQGVYVDTNSGWFSDRTVRYLASGKPALVQETGFSRHLPTGEGLIAFRTLEEAVVGARRIVSDYERHCQAARNVAVKYFDSDKVLARMLEEVGL